MTRPHREKAELLERSPPNDLYERDFYRWTVEQARAVREGRWADLDWENVAEEIESVGRSDRRSVESHLRVLIAHLLKCILQPDRRTGSWDNTIRAQRKAIELLLRRNPGLRNYPAEVFSQSYEDAVFMAYQDTGIAEAEFPATPPFSVKDALSPDYFPPELRARR